MSLSPSRSVSLVVATRYARTTTTTTVAPVLSLSSPVRTQAPRGHSHSPIALRSRPFGCSVRYARTSPSGRHYFTRVPPRHPRWQLCPIPLCYHNLALSSSSPALVPRLGLMRITEIMTKCRQVLAAQRWLSSRAGPPLPWSRIPRSQARGPLPPALSEMCLIYPFSYAGPRLSLAPNPSRSRSFLAVRYG